jgi:tetratricopeptide (TPR) repeat protein
MDWLDRISILVIVVLIAGSVVLIGSHKGEAVPERNIQQMTGGADGPATNVEIENNVRVIKNFIETNNLEKAGALTQELIQKYPYEGGPRMMMGDIYMRRQEPLKAVPEYKEAVDLNPDYLDKKTLLFQGKKIKVAVTEALAEIEKRARLNLNAGSINSDKKNVYYLQRKIAGSCS